MPLLRCGYARKNLSEWGNFYIWLSGVLSVACADEIDARSVLPFDRYSFREVRRGLHPYAQILTVLTSNKPRVILLILTT